MLVGILALAMLLIAMFRPEASRVFLNQLHAAQSIRSLNAAEQRYKAQHPDKGFACGVEDLSPQTTDGLAYPMLTSGIKSGYHFDIRCPQNVGRGAANYFITAVPTKLGIYGNYALCSDQTGEVWYSENGSAPDCLRIRKPIGQEYR